MKFTNKYNLPKQVVEFLELDDYDYDFSPNSISATQLVGSPYVRLLTAKHWDEIEVDVSDRIWSIFGTSVHDRFNKVSAKNRRLDIRNVIPFKDWNIRTKPDIVQVPEKLIQDYKVTSMYKVLKKDYSDWEAQVNIYAWGEVLEGRDINNAEVIVFARDWQRSRAKIDNTYPQIPIIVLPLKLWTFTQQQEYIDERLGKHKKAASMDISKVPYCTPAERWAKKKVYAVMKKGRRNSMKNHSSKAKATKYMKYLTEQKPKDEFSIEERPGEDTRCHDFCAVNKFCRYYQKKYGSKK